MTTFEASRNKPFYLVLKVRLALAVWVSVAVVIAPAVCAEEHIKRFPITPYVEPKQGTFFELFGKETGYGRHAREFLRKMDSDGRYASLTSTMPQNELARRHTIAYESYQSMLLHMKVFLELNPSVQELPRSITHTVLYPDDTSELVPLGDAMLLTFGLLQWFDSELEGSPLQFENLTGEFNAAQTGKCPFDDGPVYLKQRGHLIEGTRGDELLLFGTAGKTHVWLLTSEQRYAQLTVKSGFFGKSAKIDAPDQPSELYSGNVRTEGIDLVGEVRGECNIRLTRVAR